MSQVGEDAAPKSSQEAAEPGTNSSNNELPKDPFASKSSQMLFDAIDQLQSCDASQDIDIPQLVIVGGQSAGKSSLLQSLTSIPFPVSHGLCTRFATRIISRRTPPRSKDEVIITIVKPDFELDHIFNYSNDSSYEKYMYRAERLDSQMFAELMEEVCHVFSLLHIRLSLRYLVTICIGLFFADSSRSRSRKNTWVSNQGDSLVTKTLLPRS